MTAPQHPRLFLMMLTLVVLSPTLVIAKHSHSHHYPDFEDDIIQLTHDIALLEFGIANRYECVHQDDLLKARLTMNEMIKFGTEHINLYRIKHLLDRVEEIQKENKSSQGLLSSLNSCDFKESVYACFEVYVYPEIRKRTKSFWEKYSDK